MYFWNNKVVVVANCENNLGIRLVKTLMDFGMIVIGFCKSGDSLQKVEENLKQMGINDLRKRFILKNCNFTDIDQVKGIFQEIEEICDVVSVLINIACFDVACSVSEDSINAIEAIIETNINAVITFTRLTAGPIIDRNDRGHIIFINDFISNDYSMKNDKSVYLASRAAVSSINNILRHELAFLNANIKVSNIICEDFKNVQEDTLPKTRKGVADIVKFVLNTPEHLQIHEIFLDLDQE